MNQGKSVCSFCARSVKGKRALWGKAEPRKRPSGRGDQPQERRVLSQWSMLGYMDALTFDAFISQKLLPEPWAGAALVMDNSFHSQESDEIEALV
jgi:hypothetical protein